MNALNIFAWNAQVISQENLLQKLHGLFIDEHIGNVHNFSNSFIFEAQRFTDYTTHFLNGERLQCKQLHLCSSERYCIINVLYINKTKDNLQHKGDA